MHTTTVAARIVARATVEGSIISNVKDSTILGTMSRKPPGQSGLDQSAYPYPLSVYTPQGYTPIPPKGVR